MNSTIRKLGYCLLTIIMIVSSLYTPTFNVDAKTLGDLKNELAEFERDYNENNLQQQLTEKEKKDCQDRIVTAQKNIEQINLDVIELNKQIEELGDSIESMEEEIKVILSFTQITNGESVYLEYAFGAADFTDFIYRIAVAEQLTTYNNDLVEQFTQKIEESKKKQEELRNKKAELESEEKQLQIELDKIKEILHELDENSLTIEEEIKVLKSRIKTYEEKGCKDNESIDVCGRNILPPDTEFWRPLERGYTSSEFGMRFHPIWKENRMHYGIDLLTSGSDTYDVPIYSIANGLVVGIITPTPGTSSCGLIRIYIEHNVNGTLYTSGYWHLRRGSVKVGDTVTKDTVIGIMGGNPKTDLDYCSTTTHLHLEISRGVFGSDYSSRRFNARSVINFPTKGIRWADRIAKY